MTGELRVVVHSLAEAREAATAAAEKGAALVLLSGPAAGGYAGPAWFAQIAERVQEEFPALTIEAVLDCGDEAGSVLAALRRGLKRVRFTGDAAAATRLADIALQQGAVLERGETAAHLDLRGIKDPASSCREFLTGNAPSG